MNDLEKRLASRYLSVDSRTPNTTPEAVTVTLLDAVICLQTDPYSATFIPHADHLEFVDTTPDFTLYFDTLKTLESVLGDPAAAMQAFRESRFRSSGYILWTFQTIRMFRPQQSE